LSRFSPDGRFLFHAADGQACLSEVATGKLRWKVPLSAKEGPFHFFFQFDARSRIVVVSASVVVEVFDVLSGERLALLPHSGHLFLSRGGRWLTDARTLWDLRAGSQMRPAAHLSLNQDDLKDFDIDESGSRLVTAHADGTCLVWDLAALKVPLPPAQ